MITYLVKDGDSLRLVIDQAFLRAMEVDEETPVKLDLKGKELFVSAAKTREEERPLQEET